MRPRLPIPIVLVALAGCREESPEAAIRKAFDACVKAIQESDPLDAAEVLSPAFSGPEGMTRDEARLYLVGVLRREKVGITVLANRIEARGARGTQSVEVLLTGREESAFLPRDASRRLFLLQWERLEGRWRLKSLEESR